MHLAHGSVDEMSQTIDNDNIHTEYALPRVDHTIENRMNAKLQLARIRPSYELIACPNKPNLKHECCLKTFCSVTRLSDYIASSLVGHLKEKTQPFLQAYRL